MPLKRKIVTIYLDDPTDPDGSIEHQVEVRAVDMLTAEIQGKALPGVELTDGMHTMHLSAWAALCREDKYKGGFKRFMSECITVQSEKDDEVTVDPTQPAAPDDSAST